MMDNPEHLLKHVGKTMSNKKPDHMEYYDSLKPEEQDTTEYPLDRHAKITHRFTTPFMELDSNLPDKMRLDLIDVLIKKEQSLEELKRDRPEFYELAHGKGFYATTHYNLFDSIDEFPSAKESILGFEQIAMTQIRHFIRRGWGVQQADELAIEGRCFGNVQIGHTGVGGSRTFPHYHQGVDGVMECYLKVGDESVDLKERVSVGMEQSARHGSHQLLFTDPRPAINYPYWEKVYAVTPRVGFSILHPAYMWHETNPWLGEGMRIVIVVNFRIASHGYNELLSPLRESTGDITFG